MSDKRRRLTEREEQELLFQKRLAELRARNNQFPWNMKEQPDFEIPAEQSKLFADRYIEDPSLSDEEVERRALLDLNSFNFWSFYKRLNYEVRRASRYKRPLSLLFVTVDKLANVVESFGLQGENAVILGTGRGLLGSVRDVDIAGRCRDDCFGVILPETPRGGAEIAAERIRTRLENLSVDYKASQILLTVTVGGASLEEGIDKPDQLIALTVEALQLGIRSGGNTVNFPVDD
ncbi:MAG: diguanylate cyclase [Candidatus Melainabacteria bacterium]|nr:diguanylate cyclase [Candidatus Melainabacteria bacterium]